MPYGHSKMLNPQKSRWTGLGSKFRDGAFTNGHPFFEHLEIALSCPPGTPEREHLLLRDGFANVSPEVLPDCPAMVPVNVFCRLVRNGEQHLIPICVPSQKLVPYNSKSNTHCPDKAAVGFVRHRISRRRGLFAAQHTLRYRTVRRSHQHRTIGPTTFRLLSPSSTGRDPHGALIHADGTHPLGRIDSSTGSSSNVSIDSSIHGPPSHPTISIKTIQRLPSMSFGRSTLYDTHMCL